MSLGINILAHVIEDLISIFQIISINITQKN